MNARQDVEAARAAADKAGAELLEEDHMTQHASPKPSRKKKKKRQTPLSKTRSDNWHANDMPNLTYVCRHGTQRSSNYFQLCSRDTLQNMKAHFETSGGERFMTS